jgi:hypothetical protein
MAVVAFALPILPGQGNTVRRLGEKASGSGPLRDAYEESRQSLGITEEKVWLQKTPTGEVLVIYWETDDPQRTLREIAASQDQFDCQFRKLIESTAPALDLSEDQPLSNELLFEWSAS